METGKVISFERLGAIRNFVSAFSQLGDHYIFTHIKDSDDSLLRTPEAVRVDGLTICLLLKGSISMVVNDEHHILKPVSLMMLSGNSMIRVTTPGTAPGTAEIDAYVVFISHQLLQDVYINPTTVNFSTISASPSPILGDLTEEEEQLLKGYMSLLDLNAHYNPESLYSKNAAISLVQALLYQLMQIRFDHTARQSKADEPSANRSLTYVRQFLKLLQDNYYRERSLAFYAEKLYISPKYLSRLVNDSTGRTATDWIDNFVLLEAKNLLRYSNKNIQQVAYALNFPTQSSFGKFFKRLTGISPSDFQKS